MTLKIEHKGSHSSTQAWLRKLQSGQIFAVLDKYGQMGVDALRGATPVDSSETASAWTYEAKPTPRGYSIHWRNTHLVDGIPVAVMLQYGHGTGTGGYVVGRDFINPAIRPIFDQIMADLMREVTK